MQKVLQETQQVSNDILSVHKDSFEDKYRGYFFQNFYLQGMQAGIQTQHCTVEMFVKYSEIKKVLDIPIANKLYKWATKDKTTIILNGGTSQDLRDTIMLFDHKDNKLPWSYFVEDGLDNTLTNVGIIVPECIYKLDIIHPNVLPLGYTEFELALATLIKSKQLMK